MAFLPPDLREVDPVDVNFGNVLQLTGMRLTRDPAGITLRLRWRANREVRRAWRCFVHVLSQGRQISDLDHEILEGRPPVSKWEDGDEGYESLRLWLADEQSDLKICLGVYDAGINVRAAVLASTLQVTDESSAVWIEPGRSPGASYLVQFPPLPMTPVRIVFERGIELGAYSLSRSDELVWLRLNWIVRRAWRWRQMRFFGHVVPERAPEISAAAQFDKDLSLEERGLVTAVEENVVRAVKPGLVGQLRVGVFTPSNGKRLRILSSSVDFDDRYRCAYLEWPLSAG